jgi:hypothetical protein
MHKIARTFTQLAAATAMGLSTGRLLPMPVLLSLLAGLMGGRLILQRRRTRFSRLVLHFGSSESRRRAA